MLAMCLLAGVLSSASAGSAVSRSQPDVARRLLQDDEALCKNEFDRKTNDGEACCFPVTFGGKPYYDCVSDADKLWCATGPNDSLVECESENTGVREIDASGEESSSAVEDAMDKLDGFFEGPTPAPVAAERYSINDHRCSFPHEDPNGGGEMVYDCFVMADDYNVAEYDENSARRYCYIEGRSGKIEQCAVAGYKPGPETEADAGDKCFRKSRKTIGGKICSFPQQNTRTKDFTCECYTIHNDAEEASYDDEIKYYCQPDGELDTVEECSAEQPEEDEAAAATGDGEDESSDDESSTSDSDKEDEEGEESSSSDRSVPAPEEEEEQEDSSTEGSDTASTQKSAPATYDDGDLPYGDDDDDNTLAIALGVGIPAGLLLIAGVAGLGYWFVKKRPAAKATSFSKFEGGDNPVKGGAVSHKDVAKTGEGLSAVSRYTEA